MELFPYEPRKHQEDIVLATRAALSEKGHMVLESGTGTGKTICALASALELARETEKRVLYLTRTNSQQRQVMLELRAINERSPVLGAGVYGRSHMCTLAREDSELASGNSEELSGACTERKNRVIKSLSRNEEPKGCPYFAGTVRADLAGVREWCARNLPTVEEFVKFCESRGLCPYETNKSVIQDAEVVAAPYIFFFNPFIRRSFLGWLNCAPSDLLLVIDEAHNLPDFARELRSSDMGMASLKLAGEEMSRYGDLDLGGEVRLSALISELSEGIRAISAEYVIDEDGLVPPSELETRLMSAFSITSVRLQQVIEAVIVYGQTIRDRRLKKGKLPRSYIHNLGHFLFFWTNLEESGYVKLVCGGANPKLEGYCLDPSLACEVVHECAASLHQSGTLSPLDEYRDSIGLPKDAVCTGFPSPFPENNRLLLYMPDVTSRYDDMAKDPDILSRMEGHVADILGRVGRSIAVFFPSYSLMERFVEDGVHERSAGQAFMETRGMVQEQLMDTVGRFKETPGSVLFAVTGGRVSEGIDFPGDQLEVVVLAGIPYPRPTARQKALQRYYDIKFDRGWEYTVQAPTTRKMLQAVGRLIRKETDRGVAVIMDKRAIRFKEEFKGLRATTDPARDCIEFFG